MATHTAGLRLLRVAAAARDRSGPDAVARFYAAAGGRIFDSVPDQEQKGSDGGYRGTREFVNPMLADASLPADLADALDDETFDAQIRRATDEALALTGQDVGTPIVQFQPPDGMAFFGPVISRLPSAADGVRLWDHVGEPHRLIAWDRELAAAHQRLRQALRLARDALDAGASSQPGPISRCSATGSAPPSAGTTGAKTTPCSPRLAAHDSALQPALAKLRQDHELIATLLTQFDQAISSDAPPAELSLQLDGVAAIMESHFRYEERQLLGVLSALELDADPHTVLGPL